MAGGAPWKRAGVFAALAAVLFSAEAAAQTDELEFESTVADQTFNVGVPVNLTLPATKAASFCNPASSNYSLSPTLPAGLSFDSTRSARRISGTPSATAAQAEYTYSANNTGILCSVRNTSQKFKITVVQVPVLSAGSISDTSATLTLINHTGAWWLARTTPSGGSCTAVPSGTYSYTVSNLTASSTYAFTAYNDNSCSTQLDASPSFTTLAPQPVLTAGAVGATTATLTIANHTGDWYYKYTAPSGGQCSASAVSGTSTAVSGLQTGTAHTFAAYSDNGCSSLLATAAAFTTKPGKVAGLTAAAGSDASIDLSWTAATGAASYKAQYKSGAEDWSSTRQVVVYTNSHTLTKSSVTANTAYTIRVAATNATGDGAWSDEVVATPVEVTLAASSVEADTATLTIGNYTGTWYYQRTAPTAGTCSTGVATAAASVSGLSPGETHTFEAYGDSQCTGDVLATSPKFLTKPGKVAGVAATAAAAALDVSWTATTGASSYKVQWKSGSDDWDAASRQTTATTAAANIPSLTNDTAYTVRVAAVNDSGDGAWSDTATGTPSGSSLRLVYETLDGALFAIQGHSGNWYSKVTPPADAACERVSSPHLTVHSKESATGYTVTAYSDSSCNTQLTSMDFTTLPAKVAGVTATARAASLAVNWTAETGSAPTSYKVQWKSGAENWDETSRQVVATKTSAALTGLTNATQHTIRVAATTAGGDGDWSDTVTGTPSATAVTLTGTVTASGGAFTLSNHSGDWWYKIIPPSAANCDQGPSGGTFVSSTLSSGTQYTLTAYSNSSCTTALTSLDFLTLPGKTTGVTAENTGGALGVSWTAVTGAASYKAQWKSSADSGWDAANRQTTSTTTSATLTALTNDTAYTVRVAAVNASGDGAWSDTASGTPSVVLTASNVTATGATLSVAGRSSAWYLKGQGGGGYSLACTQVSGTTHSLTLQGNTTYTYEAYGTSGCTGTALASTSFTTPGAVTLIADNITDTSAEFWLIGYETLSPGGISYEVRWDRETTERGRRCVRLNRLSNGGFGWDGMVPDTNYTAEVYRPGNCTAIDRLASTTFTTLAADSTLPTLSASNVTSTGATLTLSDHTGTWWYSDDFAANPKPCIAVTGGATEAHVTGLTANKTHHFTAWSDSACGARKESVWKAHVSFTTTGSLSVAVGDKTSTGFTVNLRGYTQANGYPDRWSVNISPSTGNSCQTLPRAATSATFSGLKAGTQYTIRVFKNSYCSNLTTMINKTPTTTVSMNAGSVGPSSASLTLDHHEGDWSYRGGRAGSQASASAGGQANASAAGQVSAGADRRQADASSTDLAAVAPRKQRPNRRDRKPVPTFVTANRQALFGAAGALRQADLRACAQVRGADNGPARSRRARPRPPHRACSRPCPPPAR